MSIATAIQSAQAKVAAAYSKCNDKGATIPATQDLAHLDDCIDSIPTGTAPNLQTLNVTPTTSAQQITPTSPVDGYDEVNVSAVTSAIDPNIVASNIKKDVSILGVMGTYEGGDDFIYEIKKGTKTTLTASEGAKLAQLAGDHSLEYLFQYTDIVSADLSSFVNANSESLSYLFYHSNLQSIDLSNWESCSVRSSYMMSFTKLTSVSLPKLASISNICDGLLRDCGELLSFSAPLLVVQQDVSCIGIFTRCNKLQSVTIHPGALRDSREYYNFLGTPDTRTFTTLRLSAEVTDNIYLSWSKYLDSDSILDVLNHLSTTATGKTCAFASLSVSSSDPNYAAISAKVAALTNWTITGLTL